ncbi:MAG: terpene cyclase/mutase family protein [Archangium sp.]|nr:terpene cyclase/mutase family protein [Archangium sp.]
MMNVEQTIKRGLGNLERLQAERGSWPSDYGGPMFLLPMWVALAYVTKRLPNAHRTERLLTYFTNVQRPDGSIGLHAESTSGSMFTSTLSYVAMRLLGMQAEDPRATTLLGWIHSNGGALGAASWGKFTLCLLGLYDWKGIVPLLPELWILPPEAPLHPSRLWCHARMVYLPMAWLYGNKCIAADDPLLRSLREELYQGTYQDIAWEAQREVVAKADSYRPSTAALKGVNLAQVGLEKLSGLLRKRALDECLKLIRHEDAATHDLDIGPVNAVLNMFVHHFRGSEGRADFERGWPKFDDAYLWDGHDGLKMQGYNNAELWDTAFAMQAITASERAGVLTPDDTKRVLGKAYEFLRANQILEDVPEAARHYRHPSRGGWPFSNREHGWPITDCTAEGLKCALALEGRFEGKIPELLLHDAVRLMLSWQNADGGWATYEKQRGGTWLEALNPSQVFGDIMIDASFVECTSACIQALVKAKERFGSRFQLDDVIARGVAFLRSQQRPDGSFEGSWAVCFTYGTWFGISGLRAAGVKQDDPAIQRAVNFLLRKQRSDGSWSEHGDTCRERRWLEGDAGHAAQTSWAMSALLRAECTDRAAIDRAAEWLCAKQEADGSWAREPMVGVFNRTCLINYDCYRHYFPVWALAEWKQASLSPLGRLTSEM